MKRSSVVILSSDYCRYCHGRQVPRSAVTGLDPGAGKGILFVVENGLARKRDIRTGTLSGDMVEVATGLKKGEQYVIRGGFNLKDGDRVAVAAQTK